MVKKKSKKQNGASSRKKGDIAAELSALGKTVENAMRAAARSKTAREIPSEVLKGLRGVGDKIQKALEEIANSEETQDLKRQAQKIYSSGKKKSSTTSRTVRSNVSAGLKAVAKELDRLAGKIGS